MPIYDYRCTKGHTFDVMQSVSDPPLQKCEVCGSPVVRVLHPPAVHFKGSGFYSTDYGKRKRQKGASESAGSESGSSGESASTEKKADSGSSSAEQSKPASTGSN